MRNIGSYATKARKYFAYGVKCMWHNKKLFWAFLLFCQVSPLPWVADLIIFGFALYNLVKGGELNDKVPKMFLRHKILRVTPRVG